MGGGSRPTQAPRHQDDHDEPVRVDLPPGLRIGLLSGGLPEWALRIGTLSADDCLLEFAQPGPCFALGSEVVICVRSAEEPDLMKGPARVEFRADDALSCTYRCRFTDSRKLRGLLPDGIRLFFNRRRAHRILADARHPVSIRVSEPESGLNEVGELVDISDYGLTVQIPRAFEDKMFAAKVVTIRFKLPDHEVVTLFAHIRNRRPRWRGVHWGLEFDAEATDGYLEKSAIVRSYVMKRQESLTPG